MTRLIPLVVLPALLLTAPAGPAAAAPASVSIAIADGVTEAASGAELDYITTVTNDGAEPFTGTVVLEAPPFVALDAEDGEVAAHAVTWEVDLEAGASVELTATGGVGDVPGGEYQVVVLASVRSGDEVLVRAADANDIPGTVAPPEVPGMTEPVAARPAWLLPAILGAGIALLALFAVVVGVVVRRRAVGA